MVSPLATPGRRAPGAGQLYLPTVRQGNVRRGNGQGRSAGSEKASATVRWTAATWGQNWGWVTAKGLFSRMARTTSGPTSAGSIQSTGARGESDAGASRPSGTGGLTPTELGGAGQVGGDRSRQQHGQADPVRIELLAQGLGQPQDGELGCRVHRLGTHHADPERRHGPGVDHVSLTGCLDHPGQKRSEPVDHTEDVDAEDPLPVLRGALDQGPPSRDPRVVAEHVDVTRTVRTPSGAGPRPMPGRPRRRGRPSPRLRCSPELFGRPECGLVVTVGHHYSHAFAGERGGHGQTDTAGAAGHHRAPALEVLHVNPPRAPGRHRGKAKRGKAGGEPSRIRYRPTSHAASCPWRDQAGGRPGPTADEESDAHR